MSSAVEGLSQSRRNDAQPSAGTHSALCQNTMRSEYQLCVDDFPEHMRERMEPVPQLDGLNKLFTEAFDFRTEWLFPTL